MERSWVRHWLDMDGAASQDSAAAAQGELAATQMQRWAAEAQQTEQFWNQTFLK